MIGKLIAHHQLNRFRTQDADVPQHASAQQHLAEARIIGCGRIEAPAARSEEHTSELQSLMRISYAVFCLKKKQNTRKSKNTTTRNKTLNNIKHTLETSKNCRTLMQNT